MNLLLTGGRKFANLTDRMNRFIKALTVIGTLTTISISLPAAESAPAAKPQLKMSEMIFDFGKVKPTDTLKHDFWATNTGNAVLEITDVKPGCGCTHAGDWDKKVEPGKAGKIPIAFNPGNFNGAVTKYVNVSCNDPAQSTLMLQIKAEIWRPLDVQPNFVFFMPVQGEEHNEVKTVKIVNNTDEVLTLEKPESTTSSFKTELKTVRAGKEYELQVQYVYSPTNPATPGNITIKTSSTNLPVVNVSVSAAIQPALVTIPNVINLPGAISTSFKHNMHIRNNSSTEVKLSDPVVSIEGVTAKITEVQPGKIFMAEVDFPANFQVPAGKSAELEIKTTHPKMPVLKIPILQVQSTSAAAVTK
jgi:hypothetical protein